MTARSSVRDVPFCMQCWGEMKRTSGVHAFPRTKKAAQEDAGMNLCLPVLQVLPFFILPDYSAA